MPKYFTREQFEQETGVDLLQLRKDARDGIKEGEGPVLYKTADEVAPKVIIEIGAKAGTSSVILALAAKKHDGRVYSFDPRPDATWPKNVVKYGVGNHITLMGIPSPWVGWGTPGHHKTVDYLLIDGDHKFIPVLCDFYYWYPFVRPGGRIVFHDIWNEQFDGSSRALLEIKKTYPELKHITSVYTYAGLSVWEKPIDSPKMHQFMR